MKQTILIIFLILFSANIKAQTPVFNNLLQKYVSKNGDVDYKNFDSKTLNTYLNYLNNTTINTSWSKNKQKAFWINAYNAYTISLILKAKEKNQLKGSILNIKEMGKTAWKIPFAKVGGKTYTLDYIEHKILRRKFSDPRIHVGVNCASLSCPKLSNRAFTEKNVNTLLTKLMKEFVNNKAKNKLNADSVQISPIFKWFKEDFIKNGSVIDYINKYSNVSVQPDAKIGYTSYNWSLNQK